MTPVVAGIGLARRGWHLDGWNGGVGEDLIGWTLLSAPYVFLLGTPVLLGTVVVAYVRDLSRRTWFALAMVVALPVFVLLSAID
jgi:hypothetical protein